MSASRLHRCLVVAIALLPLAAAPAGAAPCPGDCNDNRTVSIDELITGVNIALGFAAVGDCPAFDRDSDGAVTVSELVAAVNALLDGCGLSAGNFVEQMTVLDFGTVGALQSGAPPSASGGPAARAADRISVVNGGSAEVEVSADTPFSSIALSLDAAAGEGGPAALVDDFFIAELPQAVTSARVQLLIPQDVPLDAFRWRFQVGTPNGFGEAASTAVDVVPVGTGDVQISVAWDSPADVDLHVVDPSGFEIYWRATNAPSGGMLDLDSNASCASDGPRNENIVWPTGSAPAGTYIVRVDYFDNCAANFANYTVTVRRTGQDAQTFRGGFEGPGDRGELGAGRLITRFMLP